MHAMFFGKMTDVGEVRTTNWFQSITHRTENAFAR